MKNWHPIDPAEKWLAKKILDPSEYDIFLREPTFIRNKIKNRIFDEIRKLISKSRQTNPPFAPEKIAQYRKIKKIIWDEKLTYRESLLIPRGDGFIIKLNPKKSQVRLRF
ncbi:MAG TPA: hypothetical protein ENI51_09740, partial [Candidatus Atribacteria bacterium]|nr:hypothetical protein [Candidatus Atribacteria bacterium]